jgi:hypothetical protein
MRLALSLVYAMCTRADPAAICSSFEGEAWVASYGDEVALGDGFITGDRVDNRAKAVRCSAVVVRRGVPDQSDPSTPTAPSSPSGQGPGTPNGVLGTRCGPSGRVKRANPAPGALT